MTEGPASRTPHNGDASPDDVRAELDRVLHSHEFRASRRCQEFLKYVVENTLAGRGDTLKERTIGIDVFGRGASYDPSEDATVRVKAGEVRKRLGLYYAGNGRADDIRIDLPAGTYAPEFSHVTHAPGPESPQALPAAAPQRRRRWPLVLALSAVVVAALVFAWIETRPSSSAVDQFWSPVLSGSSSVLICASFVPVWAPNPKITNDQPTRFEDFVHLTDQFVGGGDLLAATRISAMLARQKRNYHVKIGSDVSFQDLRTTPAILIGYSLTRWKDISRQLRFFIDGQRWPLMVTDNGAPTQWALPDIPPDRRTAEDYAIVTRVFHPDTRSMIVVLSGITQYGTDAAADLVTSPDLMKEALRSAPAGWQQKNLQLVIHVRVISGTPTSPKVVASWFW
jgi:hypothetical protein